ncbi:MAG: hypothetical protein BJ554DRAFT_3844, partial [Olpidium bornovanus]
MTSDNKPGGVDNDAHGRAAIARAVATSTHLAAIYKNSAPPPSACILQSHKTLLKYDPSVRGSDELSEDTVIVSTRRPEAVHETYRKHDNVKTGFYNATASPVVISVVAGVPTKRLQNLLYAAGGTPAEFFVCSAVILDVPEFCQNNWESAQPTAVVEPPPPPPSPVYPPDGSTAGTLREPVVAADAVRQRHLVWVSSAFHSLLDHVFRTVPLALRAASAWPSPPSTAPTLAGNDEKDRNCCGAENIGDWSSPPGSDLEYGCSDETKSRLANILDYFHPGRRGAAGHEPSRSRNGLAAAARQLSDRRVREEARTDRPIG